MPLRRARPALRRRPRRLRRRAFNIASMRAIGRRMIPKQTQVFSECTNLGVFGADVNTTGNGTTFSFKINDLQQSV